MLVVRQLEYLARTELRRPEKTECSDNFSPKTKRTKHSSDKLSRAQAGHAFSLVIFLKMGVHRASPTSIYAFRKRVLSHSDWPTGTWFKLLSMLHQESIARLRNS